MSDADKATDDRLGRVLADYSDSTRQVSHNNRYISFGLIAVTFTLLTSESPFAIALLKAHGYWVLAVGAIGCCGVIFDYLHYSNAVKAASEAINNDVVGHQHQYNEKWGSFVWRQRFYDLRTFASILGAFVLIALIVMSWPTLDSTNQIGAIANSRDKAVNQILAAPRALKSR